VPYDEAVFGEPSDRSHISFHPFYVAIKDKLKTDTLLPAANGVSEPVVNAATFGAVVIMVIITTLITPLALKWALEKNRGRVRTNGDKEGPT